MTARRVGLGLALLASAGCDRVFTLAEPAPDAAVTPDALPIDGHFATTTFAWGHTFLRGAKDEPYYSTAVDTTTELSVFRGYDPVATMPVTGSDAIMFSRTDSNVRYRILRDENGGMVEFQSALEGQVTLADVSPTRPGSAPIDPAYTITFNPNPGLFGVAVFTTGLWTSTRLDDASAGGTNRVTLPYASAQRIEPAMPVTTLDESTDTLGYAKYGTKLDNTRQYAQLLGYFQKEIGFDATTNVQVTLSSLGDGISDGSCVLETSDVAMFTANFDAATHGLTQPVHDAPIHWNLAVAPATPTHEVLGARGLASTRVDDTHVMMRMAYPVPPPLAMWSLVGSVSVEYKRATPLRTSGLANVATRFADETDYLSGIPRTPCGMEQPLPAIEPGVGVPAFLRVDGTTIFDDASATVSVTLPDAEFVPVTWEVPTPGAELYRVRMWEVTATGLVLKRRFVTNTTQIDVERSLFATDGTYAFDVVATKGYPRAGGGDFTELAARYSRADIPFPVFRVAN